MTSRLPWTRILTTAALAILIAVRKWDALVHPQFWGEDGAMFYIDADIQRWFGLNLPYQGYLHLLPRLLAAAGTFIPSVWVPAFYVWTTFVFTLVIGWFILSPRVTIPGKHLAVLAIGAIPHTGEVYLNICNLQWIAALGLFTLVIAADGKNAWCRIGDTCLLLLSGLSGPFILLSLPLFLWRCGRERTAWSAWLLVAAAGCAALHVPSLLAAYTGGGGPPIRILHGTGIIGGRLVVGTLLGHLDFGNTGDAIVMVGTLALLLVIVVRNYREVPGTIVLLGAFVFVLAATLFKGRLDTLDVLWPQVADRYFFVPKVLLVWLLGVMAFRHGRGWAATVTAVLVIGFVSNLPRFIYPREPDVKWPDYAVRIDRGEAVIAPTLPSNFDIRHPGRHPRK